MALTKAQGHRVQLHIITHNIHVSLHIIPVHVNQPTNQQTQTQTLTKDWFLCSTCSVVHMVFLVTIVTNSLTTGWGVNAWTGPIVWNCIHANGLCRDITVLYIIIGGGLPPAVLVSMVTNHLTRFRTMTCSGRLCTSLVAMAIEQGEGRVVLARFLDVKLDDAFWGKWKI